MTFVHRPLLSRIGALWLILSLFAASSLRAAENRYDVVSKVLMPFVQVLAKSNKSPYLAVTFDARLEALTDLPPDLANAQVSLALESPDKLRLQAPILGENLLVGRNGQQVWAMPGSRIQALLDIATAKKELPKADPKFQLAPWQLPLPEKQLVFLPALFQVEEAGVERVEADECRVLELKLMPEVERSMKQKGWVARIWVKADHKLARLSLTRPGWELRIRFDRMEFARALPPETWLPPSEPGADVLILDPPRFEQLMRALVK